MILRKSYGGAFIVMDSKTMGNDVCLAWPWAELAVMGAGQAAAILQRRATDDERYCQYWAASSIVRSAQRKPAAIDREPLSQVLQHR